MEKHENEPIGEVLGEIPCPECGGPAYVKRTKRRGNHYMSNCPECGIDQKAGEATQKRMAKYVPVGTLKAKGQEVEKPASESVVEPSETVKPVGQTEPQKQTAKPNGLGVLALFGVVALAAVGLSS